MPDRRPLETLGERLGDIRELSVSSPAYPAGLRDLSNLPERIYLRGSDLPVVQGAVAIVGSRAASAYGVDQARRLASDLARMGFVIVSGLARGIDAAAHRGALEAGGRTVAVIPAGLDAITPRHHRALAEEIAAKGTLLSEWPHGDPRGLSVFVQRNRLIAALAAATVVVEAASRSGALSTAASALRLGRVVLAVPGDVDRETARGCHALLKRGARVCEQAADVLDAIADRPAPAPSQTASAHAPARPPEARVLEALDQVPRTVEALAAAAGLDVAETMAALLALRWAGAAHARPGQRWTRSGA